ncbi:MAG: YggU family protein [Sedimentisphaerales bacterium]|nr:YggU family protein [Sedimentisphaerales bacterium]
MSSLDISQNDEDVILSVKVVPAGSKTALAGLLDGMLKVKLSAAPEKGKANKALISFLADVLGVKKNSVSIISGSTNPHKKVKISGVNVDFVIKKLSSDVSVD